MPTIESDAFLTRDGLRLPLRHWDAQHPRAVIVALHGMSDYSQAFDLPGPWWAAHGITVYAYDQRGFGAAPNAGLWPGTLSLCADLDDFVEAARAKFPRIPIYALGESMGGSVVLAAMASARPPRVDGVILVAPAVWSRNDMPAFVPRGVVVRRADIAFGCTSRVRDCTSWQRTTFPCCASSLAIRSISTKRAWIRSMASSI